MKSFKIYKYTNLITGMSYIGQTCQTLEERTGQGMQFYRSSPKFWEAIQEYGTDCWRVEILWDGLTSEEADIYEQIEIRDNETFFPYGYNLNAGGDGASSGAAHHFFGKTLSDEHREKLSESLKHSPYAIKHRQNLAQRPVSESTRQKQSESNTGKKRTSETKAKLSKKATEREARKKAEGYTVSDETRRKKSEASQKMWNERRPPKHVAKEVYLTLDPNLPIKEKRKILYKQFPDVYQGAVSQWTREWERELTGTALTLKGGKKEEYTPARTLFFSLPTTISLAEKRKVIFDKFLGSVGQKTLYAWTLEWESEIHPSRENHRIRLDKIPVQQFFCSLPIEMPIKEKRERVCAEFPSVAQRTIYGWMHEWHIELTGSPPPREPWNKGKTGVYSDETLRQIREARSRQVCPMRSPEYNEAHKFYLTLPHNMSISEKRKSLRKKYPNPSRKTIWRWTKQWQSKLEATQQP